MLGLFLLVQVSNLSPLIPNQFTQAKGRGMDENYQVLHQYSVLHAFRERSSKVEDEVLERESWVFTFPSPFSL